MAQHLALGRSALSLLSVPGWAAESHKCGSMSVPIYFEFVYACCGSVVVPDAF